MMTDEQFFQKMTETAWRRPLSPEEEKQMAEFLGQHPKLQALWAEETALHRLWQSLPDVTVSSNFTARVLHAVQTQPAVASNWRRWLAVGQWLPESVSGRMAFCSLLLCVGLFSFHETQLAHRTRVARQLAGVSRLAALPPVDWLQNFDTINNISQVKVADDELLAALQ